MATAPVSNTQPRGTDSHTAPLLASRILTYVLNNGIAHATHSRYPHDNGELTRRRDALVQDPFFDPLHLPHELRPRTRPSKIMFTEVVVLLARLVRVLIRGGTAVALDENELRERIEVRNACLDQTFFQRGAVGRPFGDGEGEVFVDEGCEA